MRSRKPSRPNANPVAKIETIEDALKFIDMVSYPRSPQMKIQLLYQAINNIDTDDFSSFSHEDKSRLINIWLDEIAECKRQIANGDAPEADHIDPSAG